MQISVISGCCFFVTYLAGSYRWVAEKLHMGVLYGVSRFVGETFAGNRPEAEKLHLRLNARIKD